MNNLEAWIARRHLSHNMTCRPLPLAHVTSWSSFVQIIRAGRLIAQPCPVFKEELIYLSYGTVAYKPSKKSYSWVDDEPVLLMFSPTMVRRVTRFFPFDTGAIMAGRFEDTYLTSVNDFRLSCGIRYTARSTPWHWVSTAFGSNAQYLNRQGDLHLDSREDLFMVIARMQQHFKDDDRTDHRLVAIECHVKEAVPLNEVIWLGISSTKEAELSTLFARAGIKLPRVFWYRDPVEAGSLPVDLRKTAEDYFCKAA